MYLEITRYQFKMFPGHRHTFDEGVLLLFQGNYCFIEDYALVILGKHAHYALHEILEPGWLMKDCQWNDLPELRPKYHHQPPAC